MKYIDIHTHLNDPAFDGDREATICRALDEGVHMINVGTDKASSHEVVALAHAHEQCSAIVGLHPVHSQEGEAYDDAAFAELAQDPSVVAIGEVGLDYYHLAPPGKGEVPPPEADRRRAEGVGPPLLSEEGSQRGGAESARALQREVFKQQIALAVRVGKPLMLHIRNAAELGEHGEGDAYNDVLEMLSAAQQEHGADRVYGNAHFFAGTLEQAERFIELGFTVSFTGVITFARKYEKLIKQLPLEYVMAETDAPYVAPAAYRGQRNEPLYVKEVYAKIARVLKRDPDEVREQLNENARRVFGI